MSEISIFPNPLLFSTFLRILKYELEQEINKDDIDIKTIGEDELKEILISRGLRESQAANLSRYFNESPKIVATTTVINILFKLTRLKNVGYSFYEFCSIQEYEMRQYDEIYNLKNLIDENISEIEELLNIDKGNEKTLKNLCHNLKNEGGPKLKLIAENIEKYSEFWFNNQLSANQYIINDYYVSFDEILFSKIIDSLPFGMSRQYLKIIDSKWNEEYMPIETVLQRLLRKKIIHESYTSITIEHTAKKVLDKIELQDSSEINKYLKSLSDTLLKESSLKRDFELIHILQQHGDFQKAQELLNWNGDKFKKRGYFLNYINVLERQIKSEYFNLNYDPWQLWYLVFCYNKIGELKLAEEKLSELLIYISKNCIRHNALMVDKINLFLKAFQIGIEMIINFNSRSLLLEQLVAIKFVAKQYLQLPRYRNAIEPEVRYQLISIIALYYHLIDLTDVSLVLIKNLNKVFIQKENSLAYAQFKLIEIEINDAALPSVKYNLAYGAYKYFSDKNNLNGICRSLLYLILYTDKNNPEYENTLKSYLWEYKTISRRISYFDNSSLKVIERILRIENFENEYFESEYDRYSKINQKNAVSFSINLYELIKFNSNVIIAEIDPEKLCITIDSPDYIYKIVSIPLQEKIESFDSKEIQKLLNYSVLDKLKYLRYGFKKYQDKPIAFYLNPSIKWILINFLKKREAIFTILTTYFTEELLKAFDNMLREDVKLDYARALTIVAPEKSKYILKQIRNKDSEYYNLLGNYYAYNTNPDYYKSLSIYQRAIKMAKDEATNLRYSLNYANVIVSSRNEELYRHAKIIFHNHIRKKESEDQKMYGYAGLISLFMINNFSTDIDYMTFSLDSYFNKLKLENELRIKILDFILTDERNFNDSGFKMAYILMKQYALGDN